MKACPYCAEDIEDRVTNCPYCAAGLTQVATSTPKRAPSIWTVVTVIAISIGLTAYSRYMSSLGEASRRSSCRNNLKQIDLALHNYHDVYGSFPPAYVADEAGRPMHSWRVLILPFLDESALYDAYDFSQPWDSPANRYVLDNMPRIYRCRSHRDDRSPSMTHYAGVYGPGCVFDKPDDASVLPDAVTLSDITDGLENTLMVGEAGDAGIPWTKPEDIDITQHRRLNQPGGFSSHHDHGLYFLYCNGTVEFINDDTASSTLRRLFAINDGQAVERF